MAGWQSWLALVGGILALIGQWWGANYYLPLIGGVLAIIGGIGAMKGQTIRKIEKINNFAITNCIASITEKSNNLPYTKKLNF